MTETPAFQLSTVQREQYRQQGFLVVPGLVPAHDLEAYRQRFVDIATRKVDASTMLVMWDIAWRDKPKEWSEQAVTKIQDFVMDDVLFGYLKHPAIVNVVSQLIGPGIKAIHSMLINKPPDPGQLTSRHPMHQDLYYFPLRPVEKIVGVWTAMEVINRQNGCLAVIPGSHTSELQAHEYPDWEGGVNGGYHGVKGFRPDQELVYLEMAPGDTVFFSPLLIHGSGANRTQGFRKAISGHYASTSCEYIHTEGTVQHPIQEEIMWAFERRFKQKLHYHQIWEMKSRVVG